MMMPVFGHWLHISVAAVHVDITRDAEETQTHQAPLTGHCLYLPVFAACLHPSAVSMTPTAVSLAPAAWLAPMLERRSF